MAAGIGARAAVLTSAGLVALAVPSACSLSRYRPVAATRPGQGLTTVQPTLGRQMAAGFAVIVARRPLLRATVTSVVSYAGIGMLLVCCPLLGAQRLGGAARGALLISATAVASLTANAILDPPARPCPAGHPGARQHAGDRGEHGRGGAGAGLAHPGRGRRWAERARARS